MEPKLPDRYIPPEPSEPKQEKRGQKRGRGVERPELEAEKKARPEGPAKGVIGALFAKVQEKSAPQSLPKQFSETDRVYWKSLGEGDLTAKESALPTKELILHAVSENCSGIALRALQINNTLAKDDLLQIMQMAYAKKSGELLEATLEKGLLVYEGSDTSPSLLELAYRDKNYPLLEKLVSSLAGSKVDLKMQDGTPLLADALLHDTKSFELLKAVLDPTPAFDFLMQNKLQFLTADNLSCLFQLGINPACVAGIAYLVQTLKKDRHDLIEPFLAKGPEPFRGVTYEGMPFLDFLFTCCLRQSQHEKSGEVWQKLASHMLRQGFVDLNATGNSLSYVTGWLRTTIPFKSERSLLVRIFDAFGVSRRDVIATLQIIAAAQEGMSEKQRKAIVDAFLRAGKQEDSLLIERLGDIFADRSYTQKYDSYLFLKIFQKWDEKSQLKFLLSTAILNESLFERFIRFKEDPLHLDRYFTNLFLKHDPDLQMRDTKGFSYLHSIAAYGSSELLLYCIGSLAALGKNWDDPNVPLLLAALKGRNAETIEKLLACGADITASVDGLTALHLLFAQSCDSIRTNKNIAQPIIDFYIERGGKLMLQADSLGGNSVLHLALDPYHQPPIPANKIIPLLKIAIDRGEDVFLKNNQGASLLSLAIQAGHTKIVDMLLNEWQKRNPEKGTDTSFNELTMLLEQIAGFEIKPSMSQIDTIVEKIYGWKEVFASSKKTETILIDFLKTQQDSQMRDVVMLFIKKAESLGAVNSMLPALANLVTDERKLFSPPLHEQNDEGFITIIRAHVVHDSQYLKALSEESSHFVVYQLTEQFLSWKDHLNCRNSSLLQDLCVRSVYEPELYPKFKEYFTHLLQDDLSWIIPGVFLFCSVCDMCVKHQDALTAALCERVFAASKEKREFKPALIKWFDYIKPAIKRGLDQDAYKRRLGVLAIKKFLEMCLYCNVPVTARTPLVEIALQILPSDDPILARCIKSAQGSGFDFLAKEHGEKSTLTRLYEKGCFDAYCEIGGELVSRGIPVEGFLENIQKLGLPVTSPLFQRLDRLVLQSPAWRRLSAQFAGRSLLYICLEPSVVDQLTMEEKIVFARAFGIKELQRQTLSSLSLSDQEKLIFSAKSIDPQVTLDSGLLCVVDQNHLKLPVPEIKIPQAPEGISIDDLTTLYKAINFDNLSAPGFIRPERLEAAIRSLDEAEKSQKGLEDAFTTFMTRVKNRTPFRATPDAKSPEKLEAFYAKIENCLKVIASILQSEEDHLLKNSLLLDLAVAGSYCGGRYFKEPQQVYSMLRYDPQAMSILGFALLRAQRLRDGIIEYLARKLVDNPGNIPHAENALHEFLSKLRAVTEPGYYDEYAPRQILEDPETKTAYTDEQILRFFDELYQADALIDAFHADFNSANREQKDVIIDWFKESVPIWFQEQTYQPILRQLSQMPQSTEEARMEIKNFLQSKGISFSWLGYSPEDAFLKASQNMNNYLRLKVIDHLSALIEQGKIQDVVLLFQQAEVAIGYNPDPNEFLQSIKPKISELVAKWGDSLLNHHRQVVADMVQRGMSREAIKEYLDSATIRFDGYIKQVKVVEGKASEEVKFGSVNLFSLGQFFEREKPDPTKAVQEARASSFVEALTTEDGRFSKEAVTFFLLHTGFLKPLLSPEPMT